MFQPDFGNSSKGNSSGKSGKVAFVVGDPAETRPAAQRPDADHSRLPNADEDNKWVNDRLMACYND
jgi:hypothetical protein